MCRNGNYALAAALSKLIRIGVFVCVLSKKLVNEREVIEIHVPTPFVSHYSCKSTGLVSQLNGSLLLSKFVCFSAVFLKIQN